MGVPPTGNKVTVTGMTISRAANGKLVETWASYDAMGMLQQIGVVLALRGPQAQAGEPAQPVG